MNTKAKNVLIAGAAKRIASGAGFAIPPLTFAGLLSKVVAFNQRKTFRTGQHAPSGVVSFVLFVEKFLFLL